MKDPYSEKEKEFNEWFDRWVPVFVSIYIGAIVFFVVVKPLLNYFNLFTV